MTILNSMKTAQSSSIWVENTVGRAISPFPTVFSKDLKCRHVKTTAFWERVNDLSQATNLDSSKQNDFADDNS